MSTPPNKGRGRCLKFLLSHAAHQGDDCVLWPFSTIRGYGNLGVNGHGHYAHRFMCELVHGPAPSPKHHAAHSCHQPLCINPRHLSWQTPAANMRDKRVSGTALKAFPKHKLTPAQVAEIRATEGVTVMAMAAKYGVSESCIRKVRKGENWKSGKYAFGGYSRAQRSLKPHIERE